MRKLILITMLAPALVFGQKKPNINKALNMMESGDLAGAKEMIDAASTYEKTMDDAKTWYYRGLIYVALDTTSNPEFQKLATNPLETAMSSMEKAETMSDKKSAFYTMGQNGLPVTKDQQMEQLLNYYISTGAKYYQDSQDYKNAVSEFEKATVVAPKDTSAYYYAGMIASEGEMYDKAEGYLKKYLDLGGKSVDVYKALYYIDNNVHEDKDKALELVKKAEAAYPENSDFHKLEIGLLIDLGKLDQAKTGLEEEVKNEPDNKILRFYLGYIYMQTKEFDKAQEQYQQALRIDPTYFDAQYYYAKIATMPADSIRAQMNALGISKEDQKKKLELDGQYVKELQKIRPIWEKAEQIKSDDPDVLDHLFSIYDDLGLDAQKARIEQKQKDLGLN